MCALKPSSLRAVRTAASGSSTPPHSHRADEGDQAHVARRSDGWSSAGSSQRSPSSKSRSLFGGNCDERLNTDISHFDHAAAARAMAS